MTQRELMMLLMEVRVANNRAQDVLHAETMPDTEPDKDRLAEAKDLLHEIFVILNGIESKIADEGLSGSSKALDANKGSAPEREIVSSSSAEIVDTLLRIRINNPKTEWFKVVTKNGEGIDGIVIDEASRELILDQG